MMAVRIRIELLDVTCRDTEDVLVPDTFYLMASLAASDTVKSAVITEPMKIKDGETRTFSGHDKIVFEGLLGEREVVIGGFKAFDEDFAKDWSKKAEWTSEILLGLPAFRDLPDSLSESAQLILTAAGTVLDLQAHSDRDQLLGELAVVVPMSGRSSEEERWVLKEEGLGISTWDYTIRYLITRTEGV